MRAFIIAFAAALALAFPAASPAATMGDPDVAALQVGLTALGLYHGDIDGLVGNETLAALRGLPGATTPLAPATRAALGDFGSHLLGDRPLVRGKAGWDVAALQFLLAWHGFPPGAFDGSFGPRTEAALVRFQNWAGIPPVGVAGPQTLAALRGPCPRSPLKLTAPIAAAPADAFGPRGARFHAGIDFPAAAGTPVVAATDGVVVDAGWRDGGWGRIVELEHDQGVTTLYAHLSQVLVKPGRRVSRGTTVGLAGQTGDATGPHLHFEVRLNGANVDPAAALG
jgi:murein DD-endopeptidase MepM/ murein hydrolase activator NlpD